MPTEHHCHAPDCTKACPPAHLMCITCWDRVSIPAQKRVYKHHTRGQHNNPSLIKKEWFSAVRAACREVKEANLTAS